MTALGLYDAWCAHWLVYQAPWKYKRGNDDRLTISYWNGPVHIENMIVNGEWK